MTVPYAWMNDENFDKVVDEVVAAVADGILEGVSLPEADRIRLPWRGNYYQWDEWVGIVSVRAVDSILEQVSDAQGDSPMGKVMEMARQRGQMRFDGHCDCDDCIEGVPHDY